MKHISIRQKTLNYSIFFAVFLVIVLVLVNTFLLKNSINQEIKVERAKASCEDLSRKILDLSDYLTNEMRCFVVTQNIAYLNAYLDERYKKREYENVIEALKERELTDSERESLVEIQRNSVLTRNDEIRAIKLIVEANEIEVELPEVVEEYVLNVEDRAMSSEEKILKAQEVLFNGDYTFEKETIRLEIESFQEVLKKRFERELQSAEQHTDFVFMLQEIIMVLMCPILVIIFVLVYWYYTKPTVNYSKELERYTEDEDIEFSGVLRPEGSIEIKMFADKFNALVQKMQKVSKIKSDFLANMSHEIRTPLNTLVGYHFLLDQTDLNREQKEYLNVIKKADELLQQNINNILDYSKLSSGNQQLECIEFNLWKVLDSLESIFKYSAKEKGIYLGIQKEDHLPQMLYGDMGKMRQILTNLIGNAIKFTEKGKVIVSVRGKEEQEIVSAPEKEQQTNVESPSIHSIIWLHIEVEDTGIGIPEENWEKIFQPFEQGNTAGSCNNGTGLGLSISRNLVKIMGGQIYLIKREVGSCFVVVLPMKCLADYKAEEKQDVSKLERLPQYSGKYTLLVDDNQINQRMEQKILRMFGLEVDIASSGAEAIEKCGEEKYDLIFMDIYMDDIDGFETIENIHRSGCNQNTPAIALTADVEKKIMERCEKMMEGYLAKPLRIQYLIQALKEIWGESNRYMNLADTPEIMDMAADSKKNTRKDKENQQNGENLPEKEEQKSNFVRQLQEMFFANHESDFVQMSELAEKNDQEAIKRCLHKLKGASAAAKLQDIEQALSDAEKIQHEKGRLESEDAQKLQHDFEQRKRQFESARNVKEKREQKPCSLQINLPLFTKKAKQLRSLLGKSDFEAISLWTEQRELFQEGLPEQIYEELEREIKQMECMKAYRCLDSYLEGRVEHV